MTDKELTELAAKAFGVAVEEFSPLTDDGDALRLAVRLRLLISLHERFEVHVVWWRNGERGEIRETDKDSYVATRRAIVRAAAEIGRQHD